MRDWQECIEMAFEEAGIIATPEQIAGVVSAVESGHENYGMAHGHDCIPNPLRDENERLSKALKIEQRKVVCKTCGGRGWITSDAGFRSSTSLCHKCQGEGKVLP